MNRAQSIDVSQVYSYMQTLHAEILDSLEAIDGNVFRRDPWAYAGGGGGETCVIEEGKIFERGCINFSHVTGLALPQAATDGRLELQGKKFQVIGTSCILHPANPYVPTVHMNVRFFTTDAGQQAPVWWFGGGMDLTPVYGFEEDAIHFHRACQDALKTFGENLYPEFKKRCDAYFFNKHRREPRGIGGLFFDDFDSLSFDRSFEMVKSVGDHFLAAYLPIVQRRASTPFGKRERDFQAYRRGRYVEFNLIHDRGTRFGLQLGGRTESILASLPPMVRWQYDWSPEPGSPEEKLSKDFLISKDWL